jgi:hypothetical protein
MVGTIATLVFSALSPPFSTAVVQNPDRLIWNRFYVGFEKGTGAGEEVILGGFRLGGDREGMDGEGRGGGDVEDY